MARKTIERIGTVKILGREYRVSRVNTITHNTNTNQVYEGFISHDNRAIYVSRLAQLRTEDELLLHEILHGVVAALGVEANEQSVASIARGLWAAGVRWQKRG